MTKLVDLGCGLILEDPFWKANTVGPDLAEGLNQSSIQRCFRIRFQNIAPQTFKQLQDWNFYYLKDHRKRYRSRFRRKRDKQIRLVSQSLLCVLVPE